MTSKTVATSMLLMACASDQTDTSTQDATFPDATSDAVADVGKDAPAADAYVDASLDAPTLDASNDAPSDAPDDVVDAGAVQGCDAGCKTFSSYCSSKTLKPCTCYALAANQPDPKCNGTVVTCFVDPCIGKKAVCADGGCAVQ